MTSARLLKVAIAAALLGASSVLAVPAAAQLAKSAPPAKGDQPATLAEFEAQFRDKGFNRDIVETLFAIRVDRATFDRVQQKHRHSDQRMITAAKDTRDLRLSGRRDFEDISNLTREEVAELRRHAQGKGGSSKAGKK